MIIIEKYKVDVKRQSKELAEKIQKENFYIEFVKSQEKGFLRFVNYINSAVEILKKKGKISQFIEIRARIKDINSALNNHTKDKLLDDVFGMEIICATESEIQIIKETIEGNLKTTRSKTHNKPNGYKAQHESYSVKDNPNDDITKWNLQRVDVPVVECQFKTIEVELNPEASHHDYKKVDKEEVQKMLEDKTLIIGREIPKMWVSREKGIMELSYKEIIQRIYPFVDTTKIKEPKKQFISK